ncbi:hypothetical protein L227DRAFT_561772 [Lentinus tigrinus ALCF2SS1-6]|uniref:Fe2OG dioxygenase domain-containing protein n=1 Tax=Lentinus tigrinus ALCF2SS1-6 TaxID=1328759 RepID=A0A5C2SIH0_9APHY|nr:hypothetical protein L227DRAFT_561772 [Lentinus tigrinus ALCF2SS1-6]
MYDPSSDSEDYDQHQSQLPLNPGLGLAQHPRVQALRSALSESAFVTCGTVDVPQDGLFIFYSNNGRAGRLVVVNSSRHSEALDDLEKACDPATFGVDQRDVLDVSYRKSGKLDRDHFSLNVDIESIGLLEAVRIGLLSSNDEKKPIRAELYKLNVYGKDSFFKPHKDTPRGDTMFGSLVLVLPSAHEGGSLVLRHDNREYAFDATQHLSFLPHATPRIAYVAFFSDVEHEVKPVASGHRITITYNLHFVDEGHVESRFLNGLDVIHPRGATRPEVEALLNPLLNDPSFLPEGGTLGFGLRHLYPLPTTFHPQVDDTLEVLKQRLKGADEALFRACTARCLVPVLYTIFEDTEGNSRALVACPRVAKISTHDQDHDEEVWKILCRHFDGLLINPSQTIVDSLASSGDGPIASRRHVNWITPLSQANRVKTRFAAYGNEPMMGYLYQRICMLVSVGPPGRRYEVGNLS